MKKEIRIFFTALMFFTRLPVPRFTDHAPEYLRKSSRYFPLVGWIVGGICATTFLLFHQLFTLPLSILASMIAGVLCTGAFHEDGFADVCDAFGGGWTKEKILSIMKDSRLGTYGTTGLIFILAVKFLLLYEIATLAVMQERQLLLGGCFLAAHAASRFMAVVSIQYFPYVREDNDSKAKPSAAGKLTAPSFGVAFLFAGVPFIFLPPLFSLLLPVCLLATLLLNRYFKRWIGGHTGDCLGAVQQTTEIICYLMLLLLWKFT